MEKKGLVSIIIPVYNSRDGLAQCLDSVVSQSYEKLEVIIVDDCSTDGSLDICREYERKYPYVHVYTKANEGVSAARNFGMSKAEGEYLQFADSDDRMEPDACRLLVSCMERDGSDLVIGGYYDEKKQQHIIYPSRFFSGTAAFMEEFPQLFTRFFLHVPWNKLYRRNAFQVEFPGNLNKGEDLVFNLRVFAQAKCISVLEQSVYFYHNTGEDSLSFRFREDAMEIEERLYREVMAFYTEHGGSEPQFLYRFYLNAVKNKCYALMGKSGFDREKCCAMLRKWAEKESIRELWSKRSLFRGKDRILLYLLCHRQALFLYLYYKRMV